MIDIIFKFIKLLQELMIINNLSFIWLIVWISSWTYFTCMQYFFIIFIKNLNLIVQQIYGLIRWSLACKYLAKVRVIFILPSVNTFFIINPDIKLWWWIQIKLLMDYAIFHRIFSFVIMVQRFYRFFMVIVF